MATFSPSILKRSLQAISQRILFIPDNKIAERKYLALNEYQLDSTYKYRAIIDIILISY